MADRDRPSGPRPAGALGLRANLARISAAELTGRLAGQGIETRPDPRSPAALIAVGRPRGITQLAEYHDGLLELQDAGSQWISDLVPLEPGQALLDYCAGGGGKTLAVAARVKGRFHAHDAHPKRMADLPVRAERAGIRVALCPPGSALPATRPRAIAAVTSTPWARPGRSCSAA
ncbi:RsmB/NOP family class I SAM-dependent RNA methyltransferase [Mangrovicoccus ximenensis]|uniref:hypothetical protein n=1 Tax=Mangrovicoccus ximenensis TaxID=1911570 RepID=UPI0011AE4E14|nr:hypothetical protein [Mangrovicoccus ximenensis]